MGTEDTEIAARGEARPPASFAARFSAGAITAGSVLMGLLAPHQPELGPAMIAVLGLLLFGYSGLVDQLGASRPLARAGLVAYAMGVFALVQAILSATTPQAPAYLTMGAIASSIALFLWSVGLMHRPGAPRLAGAYGVLAGAGPAIAAIAGHIALGASAISAGAVATGTLPLGLAVAAGLQILWGLVVAWLLLSGRIAKPAA